MAEIKKELIHGFYVSYEESLVEGIRYLRDDLQKEEAGSIFLAAKTKGSAQFEDDEDRDWTLSYNRSDFNFTLIRRQTE